MGIGPYVDPQCDNKNIFFGLSGIGWSISLWILVVVGRLEALRLVCGFGMKFGVVYVDQ